MEHEEKYIYDADIHIDYVNKTIDFKNPVHIKKTLKNSVILLLGFPIIMFITSYWMAMQYTYPYSPSSEIVDKIIYNTPFDYIKNSLWMSVAISVAILVAFYGTIFLQSSTNPRVRDWYLNGLRKHLKQKTVIPNPQGTITYFTCSGSPLIDLEYSEDIASALVESNLVRENVTREHKIVPAKTKDSDELMVLTIELNRPTIGELVINEY